MRGRPRTTFQRHPRRSELRRMYSWVLVRTFSAPAHG